MRMLVFGLLVFTLVGSAAAQETPVINAANVRQLASDAQINFADAPAERGSLVNGWFALNPDGTRIATTSREGSMLLWDGQGDYLDRYQVPGADGQPATILDAAFSTDGALLASLHSDGARYSITVREMVSGELNVVPVPTELDTPMALWVEDGNAAVWLEVVPADSRTLVYALRLPLDGSPVETAPLAAANDSESVVRIGRIPPPLAITATEDGRVKLWDMQTSAVLATAQVGAMPMFGRVDELGGHYLAWRDPASTELRLLNFETGEDTLVAPLDGVYLQAILLTPTADVVLGVNLDLEPLVVAWEVATGERIDLGQYRSCSRTPDLVRLSRDGTTLAIGCDTGVDIWRVQDNT